MLNATHSKWLPLSKTHQTANQGQNTQTTTSRSQIKVLPTLSPEQLEQLHHQRNTNHNLNKQFIQLKAPNSTRSGTPILLRRPQHPQQHQQQLRQLFLKKYEILSQESLVQLLNQNQLLTQQADLLNQRLSNPIQTISTEDTETTYQSSSEEEDQETTTPVYTIISVPFLARSYLPTSSVQQKKLKTNGLVKTKSTANGRTIKLYPDQKNPSAPLNLLNQQRRQQSNRTTSSQLNTVTVQNLHKKSGNTLNTTICNNINQLDRTTKSLTSTPRTPVRTDSKAKMMGIHLPGIEFQDMNSMHPIAAVEELMTPVCLDDYIIECNNNNNNNSDFEANNGTFALEGLNEMTINQMNEQFAEQLQSIETQEEPFMEEVPENEIFNIIRQPHSEEFISLTQSTLDGIPFDYMNIGGLITNSDDSLENSYAISPGSPVPTENDCIATSKLHTYKCEAYLNNTMQDDESTCRLVNLSELSPNQSDEQYSEDDEKMKSIMEMLDTPPVQQSVKRSSDHLTDIINVGAKKTRLNIPIREVIGGDTLVGTAPDTPEVCNMVFSWRDDYEASMHSHSSAHSLYDTTYSPENSNLEQLHYPQSFENPPSVASSFISEEQTPSPSNSSTIYTTNPNSPAVSTYSNGTKKKSRGRPPKPHSDRPDPAVLSQLSGNERKRYEDRCKNNEASRQSRQKNKQKLQELEAEEDREIRKNDQLKKKNDKLEKKHDRLKNALHQILLQ